MSDLLDTTSWAVTEFADADLGDLRRTQRLVQLAHVLAQRPGAALPEACGNGAMLKAAYRFFTNDDIAPDDMLQSHIEATYSRLNAVPPLGLLAQQVWARDPDDIGKRARRKQLPISQKESQKWLHSLDAVYTARDCCPTTHLISVGDREADVYDVLAAPRPAGVDLLIRASWNRCVNTPQRYVWDTVAAQAVAAQLLLHVPRRGPQPAREATLALRWPSHCGPSRSVKSRRPPRWSRSNGCCSLPWRSRRSTTPSSVCNGTPVAGASKSGTAF